MPTYTDVFSGRSRYSLVYVVTPGTQEISNNRTLVSWSLRVDETTENGSYAYGSYPWAANVDGAVGSGSTGYDFRNYNTLALGSGSKWVNHNSDGTKSISVSASYGPASTIGSASVSGSFALTTIPRASTSSWDTSGTKYMGSTYQINTNRASSGFTHTLEYIFGSKSGTIATGVGASTNWAVPENLLTEIPNSASGTGVIRTKTYSGGTLIGTKDTNITLTAPLTAVPSFTTITHSEATSGVEAAVGAYVQGVTKLNLAITGAAGYQGSTISSYKIQVGSQSVNAVSGVTPNPISGSGTVVLTGTITDSRGRTATKTVNITVLAYAPPKFISTPTVQRSNSDGTPNEEGTYLRANINASVQSLLVGGVQKNKLTYKMSTKLKSSGGGMTLKVNTLAPSITFNSYANAGTYSITDAYDVLVEVVDLFATSAILISVPVAKIFMHWDGSIGVGIGKYRENGALDVAGDIYQNGLSVLDTGDFASNAETQAGTSTTKAVTPAGLKSVGPRHAEFSGSMTLGTGGSGSTSIPSLPRDNANTTDSSIATPTSGGFNVPAGLYLVSMSIAIAVSPVSNLTRAFVDISDNVTGTSFRVNGVQGGEEKFTSTTTIYLSAPGKIGLAIYQVSGASRTVDMRVRITQLR